MQCPVEYGLMTKMVHQERPFPAVDTQNTDDRTEFMYQVDYLAPKGDFTKNKAFRKKLADICISMSGNDDLTPILLHRASQGKMVAHEKAYMGDVEGNGRLGGAPHRSLPENLMPTSSAHPSNTGIDFEERIASRRPPGDPLCVSLFLSGARAGQGRLMRASVN